MFKKQYIHSHCISFHQLYLCCTRFGLIKYRSVISVMLYIKHSKEIISEATELNSKYTESRTTLFDKRHLKIGTVSKRASKMVLSYVDLIF